VDESTSCEYKRYGCFQVEERLYKKNSTTKHKESCRQLGFIVSQTELRKVDMCSQTDISNVEMCSQFDITREDMVLLYCNLISEEIVTRQPDCVSLERFYISSCKDHQLYVLDLPDRTSGVVCVSWSYSNEFNIKPDLTCSLEYVVLPVKGNIDVGTYEVWSDADMVGSEHSTSLSLECKRTDEIKSLLLKAPKPVEGQVLYLMNPITFTMNEKTMDKH